MLDLTHVKQLLKEKKLRHLRPFFKNLGVFFLLIGAGFPLRATERADNIIHINSIADVKKTREKLIKFIWKKSTAFPGFTPPHVRLRFKDPQFEDISSLSHIDRIEMTFKYGVNSIAYLFHPSAPNNELVIYHHGHGGGIFEGKPIIHRLLNEGYAVLAFAMPLEGLNNNPVITDHKALERIQETMKTEFLDDTIDMDAFRKRFEHPSTIDEKFLTEMNLKLEDCMDISRQRFGENIKHLLTTDFTTRIPFNTKSLKKKNAESFKKLMAGKTLNGKDLFALNFAVLRGLYPDIFTNGRHFILRQHDSFIFLKSPEFSPMEFYFDPLLVAVNWVREQYPYSLKGMLGISGGGWTTMMFAALYPDLPNSYSIAGTLPFYLRKKHEMGDFEQSKERRAYEIANYLDLYVLGSFGPHRRSLHIYNKNDYWLGGSRYLDYDQKIKDLLKALGSGEFVGYQEDDHQGHEISKHSLDLILNHLKGKT